MNDKEKIKEALLLIKDYNESPDTGDERILIEVIKKILES